MDSSPNPFEGFLGDLVKMVGQAGASGAMSWREPARGLASNVASEGEGASNPDPAVRIAIERVAPVAQLHVAEVSGLSVPALSVDAMSRASFSLELLDRWDAAINSLASSPPPTAAPGVDIEVGVEQILAQFAQSMGPMFLGLQFGSAAGHLSVDALGLSAVPVAAYQGHIPIVAMNLASFAEAWTLDIEEVALFIVTREVAVASALAIEHFAEILAGLVDQAMKESAELQGDLMSKLGGLGDPSALAALMENPESMLAELLGADEVKESAASRALSVRVSILLAWADHLADVTASRLTGSPAVLREAWRRHRIGDSRGESATAALFGVNLSMSTLDRAAHFIAGVVERNGTEGLIELWDSASSFPTEAEIDAPGLWLERLALEEN